MSAAEPLVPRIDTDACKGHGRCYLTAPAVLDCDDEGYPVVTGAAGTPEAISALQRATRNCPERAISAVPGGPASPTTERTTHA